MSKSKIIELKDVQVGFGNGLVHEDISFSVEQGESITILGPSGIGKTLILKMIVGLLKPTGGEITVMGKPLHLLSETQLRQVRKNIGMLFQGAALFDSLSVFENIAYPLREYGEVPDADIATVVAERLAVVGLPGVEDKLPSELSGGQKKRVGLARALASSPKIMLFDEPTTGLDPTATRLIDDLIIKLKNDYGITCISVTHDIASARRISDRWLLINDGRVCADGLVDTVTSSNQNVIDFITGNWKNEMRCR